MTDFKALIDAINVGALVVFVFLLGSLLAILGRRTVLYRRAGWSLPLLLRRNLIFFGTLGLLAGESMILRVVGGDLFTEPSLLRLAFILQYDVVFIGALAYYVKTEAIDIEDPHDD